MMFLLFKHKLFAFFYWMYYLFPSKHRLAFLCESLKRFYPVKAC